MTAQEQSAHPPIPSTQLLREGGEARFLKIFNEAPKQLRDIMFSRLSVKAPKSKSIVPIPGGQAQAKAKALFERLTQYEDNEGCEEVLRAYFYKQRPLLATALDYLKIPHDKGLTEQDLDIYPAMSPEQAAALCSHLCASHDPLDVRLYLKFMGVKHDV